MTYLICDWANNLIVNKEFSSYIETYNFLSEQIADSLNQKDIYNVKLHAEYLDEYWIRTKEEFNKTALVKI